MLNRQAVARSCDRGRPAPGRRRRRGPLFGLAFLLAFACPALARENAPAGTGLAAAAPAAAPPVMPVEVTFESSVGRVVFPHKVHLAFGCAACHHQIHAQPLDTPHPGYMKSSWISCQTCHSTEPAMPGPYYKCALCHHSEPESISDETLSAKVVIHQSCWKCHESGTGVAASRGCGDCHVKAESTAEVPDG